MTTEKLIISIIVISTITLFTRAVPFILFGRGEKPSPIILYLGKYLPPAIICIIIVYCFKDVTILSGSRGIPELISIIAVIFLQLKLKNTMISIFTGTIMYMFLIQNIFK